MARKTTPSFITELPLKVDSKIEKQLNARFQAGRQLYNTCLNEALIRMELVRNSESYKQAKKLNREKDKKQRKELFKTAREQAKFSDYELQSFAVLTAKSSKWIAVQVDSNTQQKLATRAFKAVERILFGMAKQVRFKVTTRFKTVEGKSNKQGLRWLKNQVVWCGLKVEPIIDWNNPVIVHGLNSPVKYCRILWRNLNGKKRWFVQLINEGLPYQKPKNYVTQGIVGLDVNISNVAFVADNKAGLLPFAEKVPTFEREIKALQRKMQRSQRMHNPDNFEADFDKKVGNRIVRKKGKVKKGKKQWIKTRNYRRIQAKKAELERRKTAYAKSQNRKLVNEILRHGNQIKTEKVSIKGWQKRYGKAISAKSPGYFQSELKRKAENAGGYFLTFSTQTTALSQTHLDGTRIKKKLSERVHRDVTGIKPMHRDLFSAYLARCVYNNKLSLWDAQCEYPGTEPFLLDGWQQYQSANRVAECKSRNSYSSLEQMSNEVLTSNQIAKKGDKLEGNA
ncbi:transposase, IS605 family protein [Calothrix parasitica NIES-267]|uniref:Transposase, IS605 family protein n=1 Tax=Calothrix parasitica NIES-267 TaxID=1973488 RepID=A0A1Z4LK48_9CYAN|nr:transposase, IS605 family protein [Calothrix parasitica NIES-267]